MIWRRSLVVWAEGPLDLVLGQAVAMHGAAMVKDDCVGLTFVRPQRASDHLPK
jgi:hypothetical protein